MQKRIAVVFDSAGTLLHMYRVAKNSKSGRILENIESTALVASKKGCALVVLNTENETILQCREDKFLSEFIEEKKVSIGISCSNGAFSAEAAFKIIKEDSTRIGDVHEVLRLVSNHCPNIFYLAAGVIVDSEARSVPYVLSTGGRVFDTTLETIRTLEAMGVDSYIASGDSARSLSRLAEFINIPKERVFALATTQKKEKIIRSLKERYDLVFMVGDGINDILALRAADVGIMTIQQGDVRPEKLREAADVVLDDLIKVVDIVRARELSQKMDEYVD
ncbi:MAG: HAD family hydrolase [Methanosarcinaceae archaeon]|nr:HAD family hydrolase [Methanosarcinaceae archaeon]MDD4498673.1 HAD family hydrolase [Methanosarcinaceae archaeon]